MITFHHNLHLISFTLIGSGCKQEYEIQKGVIWYIISFFPNFSGLVAFTEPILVGTEHGKKNK